MKKKRGVAVSAAIALGAVILSTAAASAMTHGRDADREAAPAEQRDADRSNRDGNGEPHRGAADEQPRHPEHPGHGIEELLGKIAAEEGFDEEKVATVLDALTAMRAEHEAMHERRDGTSDNHPEGDDKPDRHREHLDATFGELVRRGVLTQEEADQVIALIEANAPHGPRRADKPHDRHGHPGTPGRHKGRGGETGPGMSDEPQHQERRHPEEQPAG